MPEKEENTTTTDETRAADGFDLKALLDAASIAQIFAFVIGVPLLLLGLAALATNFNLGAGSDITTERLLVLDVNAWSGLLMLLTGIGLLVGLRSPRGARRATLIVGIIYLLVTIWSLFTATVAGVLPVNDMTATIFGAVGILGVTAALGPDKDEHWPARRAIDPFDDDSGGEQ